MMVQSLCVQKSYPFLAESLRRKKPSPAYMNALSTLLSKTYADMDFMRAAMLEEAEITKGLVRDSVTPATGAAESAKLPFYKRFAVRKLQDQEFFSMVYSRFDAAADARTQAFIKTFEINDPSIADSFMTKQLAELGAKGKNQGEIGFFGGLKAGLTGGVEVKSKMADSMVYTLTSIGVPQYSKLVPRYHTGYSMLGILRTTLAVKAYQQRYRGRLPARLEQLVPAFITELPKDPFNKFSPFNYTKDGSRFIIYGYGPDGVDSRGAIVLDHEAYLSDLSKSAGDIVFAD